ncbi:MAG: FMN-binding protein [Cellulomonas sp.]
MTTRWRGTLIYTGAVAAMGAAGFAKFAVLAPDATAATASDAGTSTASSGSSDSSSGSSTGSSSGSSSASSTDSGAATTTNDTVTIVGSTVQTRYGPVQVSVTFAAGQITDVQTLQTPGGHRESVQINARATPILAQEVVAAQSAQIDTVSGATYTSEAYAESVQAAIDQAG